MVRLVIPVVPESPVSAYGLLDSVSTLFAGGSADITVASEIDVDLKPFVDAPVMAEAASAVGGLGLQTALAVVCRPTGSPGSCWTVGFRFFSNHIPRPSRSWITHRLI